MNVFIVDERFIDLTEHSPFSTLQIYLGNQICCFLSVKDMKSPSFKSSAASQPRVVAKTD